MKNNFSDYILPSKLELVAGVFASLFIVLLANSRQLLAYYGLQTSDEFIKSSAGDTLNRGLQVIDSFSATDGVVTFLIWAVVGVLCFGVVEAIGRTYHEVQLEQQLSSRRYIHPATFTKTKFWRSVLIDSTTLLLGLTLLTITVLVFMLLLLPIGLAYSRALLSDTSLLSILYMFIAFAIVFAGLFLMDMAVRFLLHRRRIVG